MLSSARKIFLKCSYSRKWVCNHSYMGHIPNLRRVVTSTAPPWTINHCRPLRWRRSWLSSPSDGEDPRELAHLPSRKPLAIFMGTSWGFHGGFIVGCCSCCSSRISPLFFNKNLAIPFGCGQLFTWWTGSQLTWAVAHSLFIGHLYFWEMGQS